MPDAEQKPYIRVVKEITLSLPFCPYCLGELEYSEGQSKGGCVIWQTQNCHKCNRAWQHADFKGENDDQDQH